MNDTPDYQRYSLEELYDVAHHINKEEYPERYDLVMREISNKEKQKENDFLTIQSPKETKGGCGKGCISAVVGSVAGVGTAILWLHFFPPIADPDMDGMNRWGGHMGLIMIGILVGGVCGACVGANKR